MKVEDFSDILPGTKDGRSFVFNPSVAHWKDDLYLCVYRIFSRGFLTPRESDKTKDINHPWFEKAVWDFNYGNRFGRDEPGIALLKIVGTKISLVADLSEKVSEEEFNFFTIPTFADPRILHYEKNLFVVSSNVNREDNSVRIRAGFLEFIRTERGTYRLFMHEASDLCTEISTQKTEKNWSFWKRNDGELFFSYHISPSHEIVPVKIDVNRKTFKCLPNKILDGNIYFGLLEKCYNSNFDQKFLFISLSTPAISRRDKINRHIGVGHLKFYWKKHSDLLKDSPLAVFYKKYLNKYRHHPSFDYFMFIYEFDSSTFELTNISDFFIPKPSTSNDVLLSFPSGIEYDGNDNLMIFYGDGDTFCKMLYIKDSHEVLENMLRFPIVENHINACSLLPGPGFYLLEH